MNEDWKQIFEENAEEEVTLQLANRQLCRGTVKKIRDHYVQLTNCFSIGDLRFSDGKLEEVDVVFVCPSVIVSYSGINLILER